MEQACKDIHGPICDSDLCCLIVFMCPAQIYDGNFFHSERETAWQKIRVSHFVYLHQEIYVCKVTLMTKI